MPPSHTSSWQHHGVGLVGKGWGNEEDSLSSRAAGGLEKLLRLCCRGQGQHSSARLAVGLARVVQGWWVLLSTCPLHRAIWLAAALGNLPGSSPAGTLAGYRAGLAGASAESGAQSPSWGSAGWCQPLSQAAVGGQGRQMAWCPGWCWRVHGPGLTGLTFMGLGPQDAGVVSPHTEQAGTGLQKMGTRACPGSCLLLQATAAPFQGCPNVSHTFRVAEDAHREVLDVCWPLCCQLEKLHIVPLHPIYGD